MQRKTTPSDKKQAQKIIEKEIEKYLRGRVISEGGMCEKWTGGNGVPDRIVMLNSNVVFVELKRPFGVPRPDQLEVHRKMRKRGIVVFVIDTFEQCDELIEAMKNKRGRGGW